MLFHLPKRLLLALLLSMYTSGVDSGAHEVFNAVFKNYNKYLRPVKYSKTVTLVHVDSGLYSIDQVSELTETLTITTWLWMVWQDEFLTWDPTKYNESQITVPSTLFWIPDIQIYSLQETVAPVSRADTFGTLTSDGVVELALLQVVKVHCNFDIKLFPFDTQNCSIKYGSWEYDIEHIDMAVKTDGFGLSEYQNNTEWELLSYTADRYVTNEEDGQYIEINFHLIIKRRPMYYIFALVVPSFVISMLAIVGLFSPFNAKGERQEKVTMGLTTLLTMAVLLLIVAEQMPKTSEGLPLIGMYILCEIIVSSIATTVTVIIMYLHRRVLSGRPIPRWLLKILCLPSNKISMSTQWTYDRVSCCCLSKNSSTNSSRKGIVNASYHSKISVENISNQVEVCLANLKEVSRFLYEKNNEQELENAWRKVTDRIDINELHEALTITTWFWMVWKDEFFTWDPSKYNVSQITVPSTLFWIPDIVLYSIQETIISVGRAETYGSVTSDGMVDLALLQVVKVHCDFDIKLFPFDTQNCSIQYGSWEYDIEGIDLAVKTDGFGITEYRNNTEWELLSYTPQRHVTNEEDGQYIEIDFHLVIKRKPMYYIFVLVVPSFVITMLAVVGLFSPSNAKSERQEKVTMGLTTLLTMAVLLLIVAEQMPKTSEGLPLIGMYILCEIIVASVATCVTVGIMYLHRQALSGRQIPRWLLKILCMPSNKIFISAVENVSCPTMPKKSSANSSANRETMNDMYNRKTSIENLSSQMEVCLENLKEVSRILYENNGEQELENAWRKVTDRIDIVMMIIFLIINSLISIIMLVIIGLCNYA